MAKLTYNRPAMAAYQTEAFFNDASLSAYFAPPKAGKTVGALARFYEEAILHGGPARNFWYVAPVYQQAEIAFSRMRASIGRLVKRGLATIRLIERSVELWHGGKMWFKTAREPENLYGEDVYFVIFDEAGRAPEASWTAVQTTLGATKGKCLMIGNMPARKHWSYQLYESILRGEQGDDAKAGLITLKQAEDAGIADIEQIERIRRRIPEVDYHRLYDLVPGDDAQNPFGTAHIEECSGHKIKPKRGEFWGVDLGKAEDYTVVVGLSDTLRVTSFDRFQEGSWDKTVKRVLNKLGPGESVVYIDETGVGAYPFEIISEKRENVNGFTFSGKSKQELMGQLSVLIQEHKLKIPSWASEITRELHNFEYHYTPTGVSYRAAEGYHDDCVDALALAVQAWNGGAVASYGF